MTQPDPPPRTTQLWAYVPVTRSVAIRYGFAVLLALGAIVVDAFLGVVLSAAPLYAVLILAVALSIWYGGLGPGIATTGVAWVLGLWLVVEPRGDLAIGDAAEIARWAVSLSIALGLILMTTGIRRERERAAEAVVVAAASIHDLEGLRDLSSRLSAAATVSEVGRTLIEGTTGLLGAQAVALGFVEGDELVVAEPSGVDLEPGQRLPLSDRRTITRAAAEGAVMRAVGRQALVDAFPDTAALDPLAQGAISVPLRARGQIVGSMGFIFEGEEGASDEAETLALLAADLGGQALERAKLYEREQEAHQALDRMLRVAPRFFAGEEEDVTEAICREARTTFGADVGMLWRVVDGHLELVAAVPRQEPLAPGLEAALEDFPGLMDAVGNLQVSFVSDVQKEARGTGLERVRRLGIHSSLRAPVAIGGEAELVLIVSWLTVTSEPDPSTLVLVRRFADQAGLALEQLERRRAQAEAARRADETHRLQEVTAALALAATPGQVSDACIEHALSAVGAEAGFVVLSRAGVLALDFVASTGYSDDELETWSALTLDTDMPFTRAITVGVPVWALTAEAMADFVGAPVSEDVGWVSLPLRTSARVHGALHIAFRHERILGEEERRWLETVVSQCAQALERSLLLDDEQRLREHSERLQELTAALSNALTRVEVAEVVVAGVEGAIGADGVILGIVQEERQLLRTIASRGYDDDVLDRWLETPLDAQVPGAHAIRRRAPDFFGSFDEVRDAFPDLSEEEVAGHASYYFVPLVAGRRANGLLTASWEEPRALSADERRFVLSVAGQAAVALDRASHYESEQTIAATLQRSFLPATLPRIEGVQLAARYLPGTADLNVGGDWFDAFPLGEGRLGLVVGDVVGKGVQAAATMAQLRNALRAFSLDRMKPSATIRRLGRLVDEVLETAFATVVYADIDLQEYLCRYTSAGHPPLLVARADGRVELLEGGRGVPLGTGLTARYPQEVVEFAAGSVLLLYTDGLVERRGHSIDVGLEKLRSAVLGGPRDPEQLLEHILEEMVGDAERDDDIALLAARILTVAPRPLDLRVSNDVGSLDLVRDALRAWLEGAPADRAESEEIVLATWEACANAIEHARDAGDGTVIVRAALENGKVRIVVEDSGGWKAPSEARDRGLGLRLIRSLMSSVDVVAEDDRTRVTFERALAGADQAVS